MHAELLDQFASRQNHSRAIIIVCNGIDTQQYNCTSMIFVNALLYVIESGEFSLCSATGCGRNVGEHEHGSRGGSMEKLRRDTIRNLFQLVIGRIAFSNLLDSRIVCQSFDAKFSMRYSFVIASHVGR